MFCVQTMHHILSEVTLLAVDGSDLCISNLHYVPSIKKNFCQFVLFENHVLQFTLKMTIALLDREKGSMLYSLLVACIEVCIV